MMVSGRLLRNSRVFTLEYCREHNFGNQLQAATDLTSFARNAQQLQEFGDPKR
jgi:hypothetical protein